MSLSGKSAIFFGFILDFLFHVNRLKSCVFWNFTLVLIIRLSDNGAHTPRKVSIIELGSGYKAQDRLLDIQHPLLKIGHNDNFSHTLLVSGHFSQLAAGVSSSTFEHYFWLAKNHMGSPIKIAKARLHDFWSRFLLFYPKEKERDGKGGLGGLPAAKQKERGGKNPI